MLGPFVMALLMWKMCLLREMISRVDAHDKHDQRDEDPQVKEKNQAGITVSRVADFSGGSLMRERKKDYYGNCDRMFWKKSTLWPKGNKH